MIRIGEYKDADQDEQLLEQNRKEFHLIHIKEANTEYDNE